MKVISTGDLPPKLSPTDAFSTEGWAPSFNHLRHRLVLPPTWSTDALMECVRDFVASMNAPQSLIILCDGRSGWRFTRKGAKTDPIVVSDIAEAEHLIRVRSYFRRRYFDNYYLTDESAEWTILFCHDDDIHFWLSDEGWSRGSVLRWLAKYHPADEGAIST